MSFPNKKNNNKHSQLTQDSYELANRENIREGVSSGITIGHLVPEDSYSVSSHPNSQAFFPSTSSNYAFDPEEDQVDLNVAGNPSANMSQYQKDALRVDPNAGLLKRASVRIQKSANRLIEGEEHSDSNELYRVVHINDHETNKSYKYPSNYVSTAKYNMLTFLPKFIFEQFSRYANLFFLFTVCIQQIPGVTPTSRFTTLVPLAVVLFLTAIKEFVEDAKRHRSDSEVNNSSVTVLESGVLVEVLCKNVRVGDIIRLSGKTSIPADIVLLSSSEPEGLCYIETSNLDGETNLKVKQAKTETARLLTPEIIGDIRGYIKSELPNDSLYTYEGTLVSEGGSLGYCSIPLDPSQILLRGALLRNTNWIYGIVVNTGHESKLMRSATAAPIKQTYVEKVTNKQIIFLFVILVSLAIFSAVGYRIKTGNNLSTMYYLELKNPNSVSSFIKNILTFIILYNNFIPISLIVTIEIVKFWQSQLINSDLDMFDEVSNTPALTRSSALVEELGQVGYIFSDKTGTLTCNVMEFKMCSVAGNIYSESVDSANRAKVVNGRVIGRYTFEDLVDQIKSNSENSTLYRFMEHMATCHTVIPEFVDNDKNIIEYQASSPDEGALVKGAANLGFIFKIRKPKSLSIESLGKKLSFEVLNVNEFNSTRKRMSILLRRADGTIVLYCKGADTVILERLKSGDPEAVETAVAHMEEFANEGLRTLCLSMRVIPEEEYQKWSSIYQKAATTLKNRQEELEKAAELIERDMTLLGATAIEDKLQDGVPKTISTLAQAGIKIWVLTGDRQETAINIGYSSKLIQEDFTLIICNTNTHWETKDFLRQKLLTIRDTDGIGNNVDLNSLALIIDGRSLDFALEKDVEDVFLQLACLCKSVICCRVSPLQKALVVKLVKRKRKEILLAIGDGANDVSMIQAAHIGVGISGKEGLQAARSSDFAISQFRYLRKLLLVHGSWSYHRLSKMVLYSFYKNIFLYMTQFYFAFYNAFSGQTLIESWTLTGYSVLFTLLPPISLGAFDQFLYARSLDKYPEMYKMGQQSEFFNIKSFWGFAINAIYHSAVVYFLALAILYPFMDSSGITMDHWAFGLTVYTAVIVTVLLKASLLTSTWTKWTVVAIPGSLGIYFIYLVLYSKFAHSMKIGFEYNGILMITIGNPNYWLCIIVVSAAAIMRDLFWKYYKRMYRTKAYHIVQEIQKYNIPDYRPRMERFRKAVHKARALQRIRKNRGYAFSQTETDQAKLIRSYDTTVAKPSGL
ncbi:hypothetical protein BB560_006568 [Smittium megazygosporum]|uniref:Phospholipid-transporting ATPase n=1 Tax=Smittium megazygosporum TaxID=133381 RepID=A0A2T9Y3U0_9FUNG|nr:hypothetical protein BB560_006568 [Smittium megazygosporum]